MPSNEPSLKYLLRVTQVLRDNSSLTVTNVAMLSRINHTRCTALLKRMELAGYVTFTLKSKKKYVSLTRKGRENASKLVEVSASLPSDTDKMYVQNVSELY